MIFRKAKEEDINDIVTLLYQVHKVHSDIRPDLFIEGKRKYNNEQIKDIINNDKMVVIVCEIDKKVVAHLFAKIVDYSSDESHKNIKTFFIDDLCVLESERNKKIGKKLYEYSKEYAKKIGCYNIALNVWNGNETAIKFYNSLDMKVQKTTLEEII